MTAQFVTPTMELTDKLPNQSNTQPPVVCGVRKLRLKFPGEEKFVFKDLNFTVSRGEKVLLLGPSGSGKSTLLQVLSGIIPSLIEVPLRADELQVPSSWGLLFQDPDTQFCMPFVDEELAFVLENLGVPQAEMQARMGIALDEVGLELDELHIPVQSLSQGMKQRLALASVLLSNPEVLFLDEPSALLDPEGREQIWDAVRRISGERTLIIVEHRIEEILALDLVNRVALFDPDGRLIGQGSPAEIFTSYRREMQQYGIWYPGVWEEFFETPEGIELVKVDLKEEESDYSQTSPVIELTGFTGYRYRKPVIRADQLAVYPGDFIAVTGPNGAGKSSLLLSLMGLLRTEGSYVLCGDEMGTNGNYKKRLRRLKPVEKAAASIGFVFQNPEFQFIKDTVTEEITFSLKREGLPLDEIAGLTADTLRQFGLLGLEERHPYQLSLGQKRRLSVAGSTVLQKPVLLLDEPTFGQDAVNTFAILKHCERLRRSGAAIVMVTHEEIIADTLATQRWVVRKGKVEVAGRTGRGQQLYPIANRHDGLAKGGEE